MNAAETELEGNYLIAGLSGFNCKKRMNVFHEWCPIC